MATWRGTFYCVAADDSAANPSTYAEANAYSLTTGVDWTKSSGFTEPMAAPDLAASFQEIVDRAGWASGNAIVALWKDNGSDAPTSNPDYPEYPTYNFARLGWPGYVRLDIVYIA